MNAELLAVAFGLLSALSWGAGDFSGGLASRRAHPYAVAVLVSTTGLTLFALLALLRGERFFPGDVGWALLAGASGALGLLSLYRAFTAGQMGLAAPVAGVSGAVLPVLLGAVLEGLPGGLQLLGFGVGLLGVWLASRPEGAVRPTGLAWALLAGLGFGGYFVLIDRVEGLFWPSALAKLAALALTLAYALLKRPKRWPRPREWPLVALAGVLDAGGNLFFLAAAQSGRLDVAAVISSLYPASTVLLARVMLHERLHRAQALGVLLSLGAIALISAG